jgi:hypothetical protein
MTPIIGLLIAIIAGLLAPRPRTAAAIVIPPMVGATAAQSWSAARRAGRRARRRRDPALDRRLGRADGCHRIVDQLRAARRPR